ncbi:hypothetical protein GS415_11820 [Rhodococcus hoagii]|nr:hypothetical protein [Prescottella equi]
MTQIDSSDATSPPTTRPAPTTWSPSSRDQGKITGSVDTDTVMLHGWVSEHTDTE